MFFLELCYSFMSTFSCMCVPSRQMRIEAKRNAVFPMCIKHAEDWKPLECSQQNRSQEYIKKFVRVFDYQWFKVKILVFVDFPFT